MYMYGLVVTWEELEITKNHRKLWQSYFGLLVCGYGAGFSVPLWFFLFQIQLSVALYFRLMILALHDAYSWIASVIHFLVFQLARVTYYPHYQVLVRDKQGCEQLYRRMLSTMRMMHQSKWRLILQTSSLLSCNFETKQWQQLPETKLNAEHWKTGVQLVRSRFEIIAISSDLNAPV